MRSGPQGCLAIRETEFYNQWNFRGGAPIFLANMLEGIPRYNLGNVWYVKPVTKKLKLVTK